MSIKLHQSAYEYAQKLIANRRCVLDQGDVWTDHKPARSAEKRFVEQYRLAAFGRWHLGEDDEQAQGSGRRYKFACGDFRNVHRCALLRAETRARKYKYADIELAATHLRELLDALVDGKRSTEQKHASA